MKIRSSYLIWTVSLFIFLILFFILIIPTNYDVQNKIYINSTANIIFFQIDEKIKITENIKALEKNPFC